MRCLNAPYCERRSRCSPAACDSFVPVEDSELEGAGGRTMSRTQQRGDVPFVPEDIARMVIDPAVSRRQYRRRRYGMHFSLSKPRKIAAKRGVV